MIFLLSLFRKGSPSFHISLVKFNKSGGNKHILASLSVEKSHSFSLLVQMNRNELTVKK